MYGSKSLGLHRYCDKCWELLNDRNLIQQKHLSWIQPSFIPVTSTKFGTNIQKRPLSLSRSVQFKHHITSRPMPMTRIKRQLSDTHDQAMPSHTIQDEISTLRSEVWNKKLNKKTEHVPVLVNEVLQVLQPQNGQVLVDMTFGAGGHAKEILSIASDLRYIAVDRDPYAHNLAQSLASQYRQITPVLSKFSEVANSLVALGIEPGTVHSFLFDLGASSMQFDKAHRGFSLSQDGPLDMRMDGIRFPDNVTAADVVNTLEPHDLANILKKYGEERRSKEIAHAIVEARYAFGNFSTTQQLADVVQATFNNSPSKIFRHDKLYRQAHVATKTFQALRIFVNNELNELHNGLELARHFLQPKGRCAVISFHSLEDRIVKRHFHGIDLDEVKNVSIHQHFRNSDLTFDINDIKEGCFNKDWQPISRKVIEASQEEVFKNPRSRSAKLRAAIKL